MRHCRGDYCRRLDHGTVICCVGVLQFTSFVVPLVVIIISRGCFERWRSNKKTRPHHSNLSFAKGSGFLALAFQRHSSQHKRDWCYQLLYIQKTEEKEARRQTNTKTSTPANGVLNTEQGGGWLQTYRGHCLRKGIAWAQAETLLLPQRSKHPREMVITPEASTSNFGR